MLGVRLNSCSNEFEEFCRRNLMCLPSWSHQHHIPEDVIFKILMYLCVFLLLECLNDLVVKNFPQCNCPYISLSNCFSFNFPTHSKLKWIWHITNLDLSLEVYNYLFLNFPCLQDFDLCVQCYEKDGHPHKMEKLGLDLDDGSSPSDQKQANPQVRVISLHCYILRRYQIMTTF
jgi:hypothetical protein